MFGDVRIDCRVLLAICVVNSAYADQVTFQGLGQLPDASFMHWSTEGTADGRVITGCRQTVSADRTAIVGLGGYPAGQPEAGVVNMPAPSTIALLALGASLCLRRLRSSARGRAPTLRG